MHPSHARTLWADVTLSLGWKGKPTGIQRVVATLVRAWLQLPELSLRLCRLEAETMQFVQIPPRDWERVLAWNEQGETEGHAPSVGAPARFQGGDVLASLEGSWMIPGYHRTVLDQRAIHALRLVTLVYDLIPCKFPQFFGPGLAPTYRAWVEEVLRHSDLIATISENSRRDLEWFGRMGGLAVPELKVLRLGDDFGTEESPVARLEGHPFVLSVGTLEGRKNHYLLYQVWRRLAERGTRPPRLVLAGRPGWLSRDLLAQVQADPLVRGTIVVLSEATDAELAWLYRNCLFTMYPSHYEGWGLPVAESLARGRYCIASGTSSLPEIGGDLVDYHDPLDVPGCCALVERALDPAYRAASEERIRSRYHPTTWKACAGRFLGSLQHRFGKFAAKAGYEAVA